MDLNLYAKVRDSARYCRDLEIRKKVSLFLEIILTGEVERSCVRFGVHCRSYRRWWKRYEESGYEASSLKPRSRRPHRSPFCKRSPYVIHVIRKYRMGYHYGPVRILNYLRQNHRFEVSASTIRRVIESRGWVLRRYRTEKKNPHQKRYNLEWPGHLQMDIKYVPQRIDGEQYYVFNAIDDCTRWRFFKAYREKTALNAVYFVRELVDVAPFRILSIQTDNDAAFTYRLSPWAYDKVHIFGSNLKEMGIRHRLIPPGAKELNGKVERSHRTDDEEFYWKAPMKSFEGLEDQLVAWWHDYNYDRPHSSLQGMTPMEKWTERFLTAFFARALLKGFDPQTILGQKRKVVSWEARLDTYLKYLDWIQSDPFHRTDVLNYYKS